MKAAIIATALLSVAAAAPQKRQSTSSSAAASTTTSATIASPSDVATELPISIASCLAHAQTAQLSCPPYSTECFCQDPVITQYLVSCIGASMTSSSEAEIAQDFFAGFCNNTPTGTWAGANITITGTGF